MSFMPLLEIKNLHVEIDGKKILNGLDLVVNKGEVHAIMGPNGSGKSTLAYGFAGKDDYEVTQGDVLKIVADGVNRLRSPDRSAIVITHYQRLLDYIVPDIVHVISSGRIVKTGGKELALELEATGYAQYQEAPVAAE